MKSYSQNNSNRSEERLQFLAQHGWADKPSIALQADASKRTYYRIGSAAEGTCMLMDCPPSYESIKPFQKVDRLLEGLGYSAPHILAEDEKNGFLLLEDFGDLTFTRCLERGENETLLYEAAVDLLIDLHHKNDEVAKAQLPSYDLSKFLTEVNLLTEWYYPQVMESSLESKGVQEWQDIWTRLLTSFSNEPFLVLRDYHVDNLMWLPDRPPLQRCGLLDFQDAVRGPRTYDLVSLLKDARRDVSHALQNQMLQRYLDAFPKVDQNKLLTEYYVLGAQRNSKIIGIFTRLAFRDKKPSYLSCIPRLWKWLEDDLDHPALQEIKAWFDWYIPLQYRKIPL